MRKPILILFMLFAGILLAGCGNDGPIVLKDDQGKDVSFENMKEPALVFLFTGNT
jgi:predicted small lipoprotein YifL